MAQCGPIGHRMFDLRYAGQTFSVRFLHRRGASFLHHYACLSVCVGLFIKCVCGSCTAISHSTTEEGYNIKKDDYNILLRMEMKLRNGMFDRDGGPPQKLRSHCLLPPSLLLRHDDITVTLALPSCVLPSPAGEAVRLWLLCPGVQRGPAEEVSGGDALLDGARTHLSTALRTRGKSNVLQERFPS